MLGGLYSKIYIVLCNKYLEMFFFFFVCFVSNGRLHTFANAIAA